MCARTGPPGTLSPSSALGTKGFVPPDSARPIVCPTSFDVSESERSLAPLPFRWSTPRQRSVVSGMRLSRCVSVRRPKASITDPYMYEQGQRREALGSPRSWSSVSPRKYIGIH